MIVIYHTETDTVGNKFEYGYEVSDKDFVLSQDEFEKDYEETRG